MPHHYSTAEQRHIYGTTTAYLRQNLLFTRHTIPGTIIGKQVAVDFAPVKTLYRYSPAIFISGIGHTQCFIANYD